MIDRGQTWLVPYQAHERLILTTQAKYDRRNLPPRWYWRLRLDTETPNGTAQDETFGEAPLVHRRYADAVPVHIYVDPAGRQKGQRKGRVDTQNPSATFGYSRAEAIRLGALFKAQDDVSVGVVPGVTNDEPLFVPRPGDVVLYQRRLYEINQAEQEFLGPTDVVVNWFGKLGLVTDDIAKPIEFNLPRPATLVPLDTRSPPWPR